MPIALVTGASRGVGRGIAIALAEAGFTVFATGRTIDTADLPSAITLAHELLAHDIPVVSLYPGLVRTEAGVL